MMRQYFEIKNRHKDHIVFYRLGDFYEMFFDDAKLASKELELTLTGRDCGLEERAPMCGVPHHSSEGYVAKLVKKGYKVAICEQVENPAEAKGVVRREIVRVVTPGTVIESSMLEEGVNNYIVSVYVAGKSAGLCFCDVSTGIIKATEFTSRLDMESEILNELSRFSPSEMLYNTNTLECKRLLGHLRDRGGVTLNLMEEAAYEARNCEEMIVKQFRGDKYAFIKDKGKAYVEKALGVLIKYLSETQMSGLSRINEIEYYDASQYMELDFTAKRNLEITETMMTREKRGSLLWTLDKTSTSMGKRLLRSYMELPLINVAAISRRLGAVNELYENGALRAQVGEELGGIYDIERIVTRIVYGNANPREYLSLAATAKRIPKIKELLCVCRSDALRGICENTDDISDIASLIDGAIDEEAPVSVKDGGVIRAGYDAELDELRALVSNAKEYIAKIEAAEREKTDIKGLKIGYNRVFGYYIEITKSYQDMAPDYYIRKQTLANCERYITPELKELEEKILSAAEKSVALEQRLFEGVRKYISDQLGRIQNTANNIAQLDVYRSFAAIAMENGYVCPVVDESDKLIIKDGRHPVVEELMNGAPFVANDVELDCAGNQIAIITGPNMAGKSTYMRQVALITLMAQIGSFVPASYARIGVVDGIYTRVGASDDLASGQSTFMVEMNEVANILKNSTKRSLLILDEIGRGTSTFDGMSIARAVIEHIADRKKSGAKTLFATHYHQLSELEADFDNIKNYNIAVRKRGDDIVFLRKIVPGGVDESYGIEVSKLAGIPSSIIKRAYEILGQLESGNAVESTRKAGKQTEDAVGQLSMLTLDSEVENKLKKVDVNTLSPLEALTLLYELKAMIK